MGITSKAAGALLALPVPWIVYWVVTRMYLYSFPTLEKMVSDSLALFMPWSDTPEEWKQIFGGAMGAMYAPDRDFMSRVVHVQLSGVMALACVFNLMTGDMIIAANKGSTLAKIHRTSGQVFKACFVPWALFLNYTLFIHGMIPFGPIVDNADKIASVTATTAFPAGILAISKGNVSVHRTCMVVGSAALLFIPIQRLFWCLFAHKMVSSANEFGGNIGLYFQSVDCTMFAAAGASTLGAGLMALKKSATVSPSPNVEKLKGL